MKELIKTINLKRLNILQGIDFSMSEGEMVAIMGLENLHFYIRYLEWIEQIMGIYFLRVRI